MHLTLRTTSAAGGSPTQRRGVPPAHHPHPFSPKIPLHREGNRLGKLKSLAPSEAVEVASGQLSSLGQPLGTHASSAAQAPREGPSCLPLSPGASARCSARLRDKFQPGTLTQEDLPHRGCQSFWMLRRGGHLCVPEGKEGHGSTCETFIRQNHPRISARRRCCWVGSGWGPGACISTQVPGEATDAPALGKGTWLLCVEAKIYHGKMHCSPAPTPPLPAPTPTASQDYCRLPVQTTSC